MSPRIFFRMGIQNLTYADQLKGEIKIKNVLFLKKYFNVFNHLEQTEKEVIFFRFFLQERRS